MKGSIGGSSNLGEGMAFIGLERSNSRLAQEKKAESESLGSFVLQEVSRAIEPTIAKPTKTP